MKYLNKINHDQFHSILLKSNKLTIILSFYLNFCAKTSKLKKEVYCVKPFTKILDDSDYTIGIVVALSFIPALLFEEAIGIFSNFGVMI